MKRQLLEIVADAGIARVEALFSPYGRVRLFSGGDLRAEDVKHGDVLLVRSVTPVNQALLGRSKVKFVGTATAGVDHLDTIWLDKAGIKWAATPGCNAIAVAEYVVCCIAHLRKIGRLKKEYLRAGVIGVGHVGNEVVKRLRLLGFTVLENDPPRAEREPGLQTTPLRQLQNLDVICVHTPLTKDTPYPTYHLLDKAFLQAQKPQTVLINAGRGAVIYSDDLLAYGKHLVCCLDVWENEPIVEAKLVANCAIATPHIAGYTREAKLRSAQQLLAAMQKALGLLPSQQQQLTQPSRISLNLSDEIVGWEDVVLEVYDPARDTLRMRNLLAADGELTTANLQPLRADYPLRHEFSSVALQQHKLSQTSRDLLKKLSIQC